MSYFVTKRVEFDAGHRVPEHKSKCRNPHGHRYVVEVCVGANKLKEVGSDEGMVIDFGDLKQRMMVEIHDVLDHGFIVYEGDSDMLYSLKCHDTRDDSPLWKVIVFPYVPTAENIARWCYERMEGPILDMSKPAEDWYVWIEFVAVYETPTSQAVYKKMPG